MTVSKPPCEASDVAIIVPMLNEAETLPDLLEHLLRLQRQGAEILLVDGGSSDMSIALAECAGFRVLSAPRGRARQMNAGAAAARSSILLFLHADTRLPDTALDLIRDARRYRPDFWGRFDVAIAGRARLLKLVSCLINMRSRLTGIATGDQAIFVCRALFDVRGGFPDQPLMEDIELSRSLRKITPPVCLSASAVTSGRRWDSRGVWRTIFLMWRLRWAYWRGVPATRLADLYQ